SRKPGGRPGQLGARDHVAAAAPHDVQLEVGAATAVEPAPVRERAEAEGTAGRHEILQLVARPPVASGWDLHLPKDVKRVGWRVQETLEIHFEVVPILPVTSEEPPLKPGGLPVPGAAERSGCVGNDVPFGDELEIELTEAEGVGSGHEVGVARRLPNR